MNPLDALCKSDMKHEDFWGKIKTDRETLQNGGGGAKQLKPHQQRDFSLLFILISKRAAEALSPLRSEHISFVESKENFHLLWLQWII